MTIGIFFLLFFCYAFMSFLSSSVFVCIYFTSSPSFILFTLCVYSTLSIENFSYLLYNNNKNQTWLVPERASVKLCKREQAYGGRERERAHTLALLQKLSLRCHQTVYLGLAKEYYWINIMFSLWGCTKLAHWLQPPQLSFSLCIPNIFKGVLCLWGTEGLLIHTHVNRRAWSDFLFLEWA